MPSGVLSKSFQSFDQSPYSPQNEPFFQTESLARQNHPKNANGYSSNVAPLPPKRKYRSIGIGNDIPIQDIICYRKGESSFFNSSDDIVQSERSERDTKDKAINCNISSAMYRKLVDASTFTEEKQIASTSFQTEHFDLQNALTQTEQKTFKDTGCDAEVIKVITELDWEVGVDSILDAFILPQLFCATLKVLSTLGVISQRKSVYLLYFYARYGEKLRLV